MADVPQDIPSDLQVVHFAKDGTEVMETKESTRSKDEETFTEISFVTDEFSVYSVTSTASGAVDNLLNKKYVLVCNGVALSPEQNTTQGYTNNLRGIPVTVSNGTISTNDASDSLPVWTVERYYENQYRYRLSTIVNGETANACLSSHNDSSFFNMLRIYVIYLLTFLKIETFAKHIFFSFFILNFVANLFT